MTKRPIIQCENLVKIYKTKDVEVMALSGLDVTIDEGELMAIIGNSGSGKSTFLNMIGGLDRPTMGSLTVDGRNLFKMTDRDLIEYKRNTVGFVWQNNGRNLLPYLSAFQNIQMPMLFDKNGKKEQNERAMKLLELVGMEKYKNSRLSQLSGGEQQRIAIAIALANHPKILLADEPTGSVDVKTGDFILNVFRRLNQEMGVTVVIVTHDRLLSKKVNRVVSIRDGKISSERILKQSYRERLAALGTLGEVTPGDFGETQDEYAILDRNGRVQIPRELLEQMELSSNQVRLMYEEGKIVITGPRKNT